MSKRLIAMLTVGALMIPLALQPAQASHWSGSVSTACTTKVKDFPFTGPTQKNPDDCDNDQGNPPNAGVAGTPIDYGVGTVNHPGGVFVASGAGATRVSYSYNESCFNQPPGVGIPLVGTAFGNFVVAGVGGQNLIAGFDWSRNGLTAVITFDPSVAGHNLEDGTVIAAGQIGIDTNGDFAVDQTIPTATLSQSIVGLLQPRGGKGGNTCPADTDPDTWEVVTAYSFGSFTA